VSPRRKAKRKQAELDAAKKISRDDIESKLRELQGEVDTNLESARTVGLAAGVGIAVVLVLVAYILGRRKGRKRQMVLEIKRI
jgi:tetrahydromethanopterin S-methyltransferase subunit F